ncbi:MAG: hypothetical protein IJW33_02165 [Lentisphaeria bacterium]|nr:hypothetical protein [Lentisphaeria bacterium]
MRTNHYRAVSHWFNWEELDFPNPGVEERIRRKVAAAAAAKVELAVVFGFHFRWDFVYNFDLVHKLIAFTVNEYHKYGIKVIDHHSAVLNYRPRSWEDRRENFNRNHHHIPMTPDPAIIGTLYYAGKKLNDFRQLRVDDGTPVYLPRYHSECFCTNNPDFRFAYRSYVQRLFAETGIDGLMCDDVGHYGRWGACGCEYCRDKYRQTTGKTLPPATDFNFWGNYENPDFRRWVDQHLGDGRDFLAMVKEVIPKDAILTTCCSSSTGRFNDCVGLDMSVWESSLNTVMLEMCGNISGGKNSIEIRIPDMQLNCGIAERANMACLGLGYAFFPDEGFRTWSLNKFFNSDSWISTHKARCGLTFEEQCQLPDEPEIVHEAYNFDAKYPELEELTDTAQTAVYFSSASRNFNGCFADDYANGFAAAVRGLYRANVVANVICRMPENADKIKVLLLTDCDCLADEERSAIDKYLASGGTVIATGLCGARDARGCDVKSGSLLKKFGVDPLRPDIDRSLDKETREIFFSQTFCVVEGTSPLKIEYISDHTLNFDRYGFCKLADNFYWSPVRPQAENAAENIAALVASLTSQPLEIKVPDSLKYRIYTGKDGNFVVHFMPTGVTANYHPTVKLHKTVTPVVESLNYEPLCGKVEISGGVKGAVLYSADLEELKECDTANGTAVVELDGLKRFFSVRVEK